jgi:hypothetical protein
MFDERISFRETKFSHQTYILECFNPFWGEAGGDAQKRACFPLA